MSSEREIFSEDNTHLSSEGSKRMWDVIISRIDSADDNTSLAKLELAYKYLDESSFPQLLEQLKDEVNGSFSPPDSLQNEHDDYFYMPDDAAWINLFWKDRLGYEDTHLVNAISVRSFPTGVIFVSAGLFGSSVLMKHEWEENYEAQLKAVRKAYQMPKSVCRVPPEFNFVQNQKGDC